MSQFSGKCDLADDFFMGMPDELYKSWKNGNWDALKEYFEQYKKSIGNTIYKPYHINRITEYNQELVAKYERAFTFEKHEEVIKDKRYKDGERKRVYYTYKYWGVEYSSLKKLNGDNKEGFYVTIPCSINTIYDLIEYFPYIIGFGYFNNEENTKYIRVSTRSYVEEEFESFLNSGIMDIVFEESYKSELQKFTAQCIKAGL